MNDKSKSSDIYIVNILDLTQDGQGVAHIEATEGDEKRGLTVFCDQLLPGEKAEIRLADIRKKYAQGTCVKLLTPSPDRIIPTCPANDTCGGCTLGHIQYDKERFSKRNHIISCLTRIGKQDPIQMQLLTREVIGMDAPTHYRNHMQYPVSETTGKEERDLKIGLYAKKTHTVVALETCLIAHPACETIRRATISFMLEKKVYGYDEEAQEGYLRHLIVRVGVNTGEIMVVLVGYTRPEEPIPFSMEDYTNALSQALAEDLAHTDKPSQAAQTWRLRSVWLNCNPTGTRQGQITSYRKENLVHLWGDTFITERLGRNYYVISPLSFFQVNTPQAEKLYDTVRAYAIEGSAKRRTLLDLYCGTGTIGLHLAHDFGRVIGVEANESAIRDARQNAEKNNILSANFHVAKAEDIPIASLPKDIDCVIIDPPRAGCEPTLLDKLLSLAPEKIIYVSCDPATLARDLIRLAGGAKPAYTIKAIQPVDLFGRTGHVEAVILLQRLKR